MVVTIIAIIFKVASIAAKILTAAGIFAFIYLLISLGDSDNDNQP